MSTSADWSVFLGWAQLAFSVFGFVALIYTLFLTRRATDAAVEANKIAMETFIVENRARLSLELKLKNGIMHPQPNGSILLGIDMVVTNHGGTPADNVTFNVGASVRISPIDERKAIDAFNAMNAEEIWQSFGTIYGNKTETIGRPIFIGAAEIDANTYTPPFLDIPIFNILIHGQIFYRCVGIKETMKTGVTYHVGVNYDGGRSACLFVRRNEIPTMDGQADLVEMKGTRFNT